MLNLWTSILWCACCGLMKKLFYVSDVEYELINREDINDKSNIFLHFFYWLFAMYNTFNFVMFY